MSDTPETNAMVEESFHRINFPTAPVPAEFARKLERERDEALMDRANGDIATMTTNHYERILKERDEARKYIERQRLEIVRLNGATNHAGGTPLKIAWRERDELAAMCGRYKQERDELREKYDNLATEHMLVVNKLCKERDEARAEIQRLRLDAQKEAEHHDRMVKELEELYDKLKS